MLKLDANAALPANVTGNAATADKLKTARTVSLSGAASGSVSFDGSANVTIPVTVANDSHTHAFGNLTGKPNSLGGYGIQDAYTKSEIDNLVTGLDMKASVRAATTAAVTLSGPRTVDGVALVEGNRVLVKDQGLAEQNGIYVVKEAGAWARTDDANTGAKVSPGMYVFVEEGVVNDNSGWVLATNGAINVGTTALSFVQFNGLGQVSAGTGLQKSGNVMALADTTVAAGAYGSATQVARVTVNAQGQLTSVTPVTITPDWSSITNRDAAPASHTHTLAIGDGTMQKMTVATNERLNIKAGANVALSFDDAGNAVTISTSGQLSGNVDTATRLQTSRTITLSGDATGFVDFDGNANVTLPVSVLDDSHLHAFTNLTGKPNSLGGYGILDAYTKTEVENLVSGLDMKASVRLATTADLGALTGSKTVDGVNVATGDRVLVKDQVSAVQNGIYIANTLGSWNRAGDADNSAKVTPGMYVFVEEGAVNDNSGWVLATNGPITLNTTALAFTQFNGLGQVTAGTGLQKSGNTLALNNTGVSARTYGSATLIPSVAVDAQGRVTGVTEVAPVGDWNTLQNKPTTLAQSGITDVYTKTQVDNFITGLDIKPSVRVATTGNLVTLAGLLTIDGVTLVAGDRVLVKDQTTGALNGIYDAAAGSWQRSQNANDGTKLSAGAYVFVEEGTVNDNSGWVLANNGAISVGTTALTFVQFNGLGQVTAGTGLQKSGNTIGLANIVSATGPVGTGTTVPVVTIDATGRVTALTSTPVTPPAWTAVTSKPTTLAGYGITDAQPASTELNAEAGLTGTGLIARTAAGTRAVRSLAQGNGITVTNGDGVLGNPTVALSSIVTATGPIGNGTTVPVVTIDATGRVTALTSTAVTPPAWSAVTSKPTTLSGYGITDAQPASAELNAEAGLSGTGLIARTAAGQRTVRSLVQGTGITVTNGDGVNGNPTVGLANTSVTQGSYGSSTAVAAITVDAQGRLTGATSVAIAPPAWTSITGKPTTVATLGVSDALSTNGGVLTGPIDEAKGADIASAATVNLQAATGNVVDVTGAATISAIALNSGAERTVRFGGAAVLAHSASLVLPGAANITAAAGDFAIFRGYPGNVVRCVVYSRANGTPVVSVSLGAGGVTANASVTLTVDTLGVLTATPVAPMQAVTLPAANTCVKGCGVLSVYNQSNEFQYGVRNAAGVLICVLEPLSSAVFDLQGNATVAGEWGYVVQGAEAGALMSGPVSYPNGHQAAGQVLVMDANTSLMLSSSQNSGSQLAGDVFVTAFSRTSLSFGAPVMVFNNAAGGNPVIKKLSATTALLTWKTWPSYAISACIVTLSGTAVSVGAIATLALGSNESVYTDVQTMVLNSSSVVLVAGVSNSNNGIYSTTAWALNISGSTISIGSGVILVSDAAHQAGLGLSSWLQIDSTRCIAVPVYTVNGYLNVRTMAVSGTNIAVGILYVSHSDAGGATYSGLVQLPGTNKFILNYGINTTTIALVLTVDAGVNVTQGAKRDLGGGAMARIFPYDATRAWVWRPQGTWGAYVSSMVESNGTLTMGTVQELDGNSTPINPTGNGCHILIGIASNTSRCRMNFDGNAFSFTYVTEREPAAFGRTQYGTSYCDTTTSIKKNGKVCSMFPRGHVVNGTTMTQFSQSHAFMTSKGNTRTQGMASPIVSLVEVAQ
ncbi:beta strand repeat-containing protein [Pseudoduganella rivuli]|uniref:beta strand repeat-containing protein n=1 Tax=Pseudoduganella rivuli TaxID=2666085 RepID=UPI0018A1FBAF|nr:hypothetical protein [Pseudoduganella rivuli]